MEFQKITSWGYVDPGTKITDSKGNQYAIEGQNEAGFLRLKSTSGGEDRVFEALDLIDHGEFRESQGECR